MNRKPTTMLTRPKGFTQFELLIALGIIAILAAFVMPSFRSIQERNEVIMAVEALSADLHWARSEALKRGVNVQITFFPQTKTTPDEASLWRYDIAEVPNPPPTTPPPPFKSVDSAQISTLAKVNMPKAAFTNNKTTFSSSDGTPNAGSVAFVSRDQTYNIAVALSGFGRVSTCSCPNSSPIGSYPKCNPKPAACLP